MKNNPPNFDKVVRLVTHAIRKLIYIISIDEDFTDYHCSHCNSTTTIKAIKIRSPVGAALPTVYIYYDFIHTMWVVDYGGELQASKWCEYKDAVEAAATHVHVATLKHEIKMFEEINSTWEERIFGKRKRRDAVLHVATNRPAKCC